MAYTHELIKTENGSITEINGRKGGGVSELSKFFGRQPGQSLAEFGKELKALTIDDKVQLVGGIVDGTLDELAADR